MKFISILLSALLVSTPAFSASKPKPTPSPRIERALPVDSEHNRLLMQRYVVLPPGFEGQPVIVENSPEYLKLVERNKTLQKQLEEEKKISVSYKQSVDNVLIEREQINKQMIEELAKLEAAKRKSTIWGWILGSLGFLIPGILIVLCIMNPAIVGVIINVFISVIHAVASFLGKLFNGFKATADKIASYKKSNLTEFDKSLAASNARVASFKTKPVVTEQPKAKSVRQRKKKNE